MTAELDIYRAANILVKEYGADQAPLMAAKRCDALLELGDRHGLQVWKAVLRRPEIAKAYAENFARWRAVGAEYVKGNSVSVN